MFEQLSNVLQKHFEPKPVVIVQRFHFHRRNQAPGETVAEYVAELCRLAMHCKSEGYLEEALQDRLVCGLKNEGLQKRLLTYLDLTESSGGERHARDEEFRVGHPKGHHAARYHPNEALLQCGKEGHEPLDPRRAREDQ